MVYFIDESKFNLFGCDGKIYVKHRNGERLSPQCVKKTVKFGGRSLMVWGMISSAGVGPNVQLHGKINASVYKQLVPQHAIPHLCNGTVETPIFIQDNAHCHKAKTVTSFLEEKGIAVMNFAAQSPDLNPIENVWKIIGDRAQKRNFKNKEDLWRLLKEEWKGLTSDFCKKLIGSCGRRCYEVIQNKGKFTKY